MIRFRGKLWHFIALFLIGQVLRAGSQPPRTEAHAPTTKRSSVSDKIQNLKQSNGGQNATNGLVLVNGTLVNGTLVNGTLANATVVEKPRPLAPIFQDCMYITNESYNLLPIYSIRRHDTTFNVYCDMPIKDYEDDEDMWTIVLRRRDYNVDFNRTFFEYAWGFGDINGDFFIGLNNLFYLTSKRGVELLINMTDTNGTATYARYNYFGIESISRKFRVWSLGQYNGTAGDAMRASKFRDFSAYDADADSVDRVHCARVLGGGWWYGDCQILITLPTGQSPKAKIPDGDIQWGALPNSEKRYAFMQIAVRPVMPRKNRPLPRPMSHNVRKVTSEYRKFRPRGNNNYLLPDNPEYTFVDMPISISAGNGPDGPSG